VSIQRWYIQNPPGQPTEFVSYSDHVAAMDAQYERGFDNGARDKAAAVAEAEQRGTCTHKLSHMAYEQGQRDALEGRPDPGINEREAYARAEGYQQGWKDCQKVIAAQQGMRLSRKATDTQKAAVKATLPRSGTFGAALWELFCDAGDNGLTDDEIERKTSRSHQSSSAARNALMNRGLLKDSGQRRKNRRGLDCIVWVRVSPSSKEPDDSSNATAPRPPHGTIGACVGCGKPFDVGYYSKCPKCGTRGLW
jgi:hypothetical protein